MDKQLYYEKGEWIKMNEYDSNYFLENWKDQLQEFRQPWPEWEELENLIHTLSFELIYEEYMNANYLVSDLYKENFYVIHKIPFSEYKEDKRNELFNYLSVIPSYFIPLLDFKIIDVYKEDKRKMLYVSSSGGIGNALSSEQMVWIKEKNEQGGALGPFPNPWEGSIPEDQKLFLLQTSIAGTDFFCSSKQTIYVIDLDNKKYLPIGKLDDFIRWCIRINLELNNWHNAFFKKTYFDDYNLTYQDTWMD